MQEFSLPTFEELVSSSQPTVIMNEKRTCSVIAPVAKTRKLKVAAYCPCFHRP